MMTLTREKDVLYWYQTNYVGFAGFTMLVWDHVDTFTAEVELIWKRQKSPIVYLFLLNRYLTPLGFIINLYAYLSHSMTPEVCRHFVRYEGAMTMIGISVVALMMFLRIQCLYRQWKIVYYSVGLLFLVQTGIYAYLLSRGQPVVHPADSPIQACTMIFDPAISGLATSSAWMPLLYDTVIFLLTLRCVLQPRSGRFGTFGLKKRLFEDGLIYYSAIFAINLVLTIMIAHAPAGLKNITAQRVFPSQRQ
ncbi:hypothetical protein AX14_000731 [Amanita brunnescens Koide BX004]|nr:hypothetical protein AX14_000731 [Amanita brunnescens Koide BX004]